jgi:hypothetical protein
MAGLGRIRQSFSASTAIAAGLSDRELFNDSQHIFVRKDISLDEIVPAATRE